MKLYAIMGIVALALAGFTQTAGGSATAASASGKSSTRVPDKQQKAKAKKDACEQARKKQQKAAMLGSALSMVGGFGGLGGRGGAVVGHVASTAGSVVASQSGNSTQACR